MFYLYFFLFLFLLIFSSFFPAPPPFFPAKPSGCHSFSRRQWLIWNLLGLEIKENMEHNNKRMNV
ncbi:hypothetical protein V6Z11_D08G173100 [Gossypium hirsutum]